MLKKLAEAEADAAAKARLTKAARCQEPLLVATLNSAPPLPEFVATIGGAGDEQPAMEREGGDVAMLDVVVRPPPPTGRAQDRRPAASPAPPAGNEVVAGPTLETRTPVRCRLTKAVSAP